MVLSYNFLENSSVQQAESPVHGYKRNISRQTEAVSPNSNRADRRAGPGANPRHDRNIVQFTPNTNLHRNLFLTYDLKNILYNMYHYILYSEAISIDETFSDAVTGVIPAMSYWAQT